MATGNASKRAKPLSRDVVVEASMRIAREQGLEAVTMRAIAADLGVTPMALYYHVENKDELVGLIADAVLRDSPPLELAADGWEASLRGHLLSLWDTMAKYPGLAGYMISLPTLGTTATGHETGVCFFEDAGFSRRHADLAWSFALTFIHGRLSVDSRLDHGAASAAGLAAIKGREHVTFGADAVIQGLKAILDDPSLAGAEETRPN
jgi:AcrR family transcriptional regulator